MEAVLVKCPECECVINTNFYGPENAAKCCDCKNIQLLYIKATPPGKTKGFITIRSKHKLPIITAIKTQELS